MKVGVHGSVPHLSQRLRIWKIKAQSLGIELRQLGHGDDVCTLDVIICGKLPVGLAGTLAVSDAWMDACLSAGKLAPLAPYLQATADETQAVQPLTVSSPLPAAAVATVAAAAGGLLSPASTSRKRPREESTSSGLLSAAPLLAPSPPASLPPARPQQVLTRQLSKEEAQAPARWFVPALQSGPPPLALSAGAAAGASSGLSGHPTATAAAPVGAGSTDEAPRSSSSSRSRGTETLTVVTYNVLAAKYAGNKAFCPKPLLQWDYRWPLLVAELEQYDGDIICLQEVDGPLWPSHYLPWATSRGYRGFFWARAYAEKGSPEGIALLVRESRFEVLTTRSMAFKSLNPDPPPAGEGRFWEKVARYEEGLVCAALRCRQSGRSLVAVCTHLWFDPRQPDVKVAQADGLCRAVTQFLREAPWGDGGEQGGGDQEQQQERQQEQGGGDQRQQRDEQERQQQQGGGNLCQKEEEQQQEQGGGDRRQQQEQQERQQQQQQEQGGVPGKAPNKSGGAAGAPLVAELVAEEAGLAEGPEGEPQGGPDAAGAATRRAGNRGLVVAAAGPGVKAEGGSAESAQSSPAAAAAVGTAPEALVAPVAGEEGLRCCAQVPVVIAGDFNSLWRKYKSDVWDPVIAPGTYKVSGVYELLSTGSLPLEHNHQPASRAPYSGWLQHPAEAQPAVAAGAQPKQQQQGGAGPCQGQHTEFGTHGLNLSSSYTRARGVEPPLTNKHKGFAGCLDYIWVTPQLEVVETLALPYECLGLREVPYLPDAVPFPPIPNSQWPSDHLALAAKLRLAG